MNMSDYQFQWNTLVSHLLYIGVPLKLIFALKCLCEKYQNVFIFIAFKNSIKEYAEDVHTNEIKILCDYFFAKSKGEYVNRIGVN